MELLIIEDDETLFNAMKQQLEKWDWSVHGINDFGAVFEEYKTLQPDMVIIDIQLPQYDGFYYVVR